MKCIFCKGETKKEEVEDKEFGISLGKFPAEVCAKCGETFFDAGTARKIQEKSKALGLFGLSKKTKVAKVGNSLAVRIPKAIAEFTNLRKDEVVIVQPSGRHSISISAG